MFKRASTSIDSKSTLVTEGSSPIEVERRKQAADALKKAHDALLEWARAAKGPRLFADEVADIFRRFVGIAAVSAGQTVQELPEREEPEQVLPPQVQLEQPVGQGAYEALREAHRDLVAWAEVARGRQQFANEVADVLRRYVGVAELQPGPVVAQVRKQLGHPPEARRRWW